VNIEDKKAEEKQPVFDGLAAGVQYKFDSIYITYELYILDTATLVADYMAKNKRESTMPVS